MAKAPDLSPRALSLVDKLLARLPASVSDLETWWERQGKVTRLELRRLLRQLDSDRLLYDRDAGTVKPLPIPLAPATKAQTPDPAAPVVVPSVVFPPGPTPVRLHVAGSLPPTRVVVNGVEFSGPDSSKVAAAAVAYVNTLPGVSASVGGSPGAPCITVTEDTRGTVGAVKPTTPRLPAKPRQSKPVTGSVSERVRASVCRKPGTVGEVIARFPDVNENTVRGALGTLKAKGLVGHTGGKYGAPRG